MRAGDRKIEALTASMFSGDLMGRGTPVLRLVAFAVCLNVVTHVTIDFRSGTGANGAKLAIPKGALSCDHRTSARKVGLDGKSTLLTVPTHDGD